MLKKMVGDMSNKDHHDVADNEKAYHWLVQRLKFYGENIRLVPYDCDCFVIQVGPHVKDFKTDKQAAAFYLQHNENAEGFLEQDWKGFDAIVLDFIQPFLEHVCLFYTMDDMGQVLSIDIVTKAAKTNSRRKTKRGTRKKTQQYTSKKNGQSKWQSKNDEKPHISFSASYAPTSRATCPFCHQKITRGSLRLTKHYPSPFSYDFDTMEKHFHPEHFFLSFANARMFPSPPRSTNEIRGFDYLLPKDQKFLHTLINQSK